jgi:hypothetical protein
MKNFIFSKELDNETSYTSKCNTNKFILLGKKIYIKLYQVMYGIIILDIFLIIFFYVK